VLTKKIDVYITNEVDLNARQHKSNVWIMNLWIYLSNTKKEY